VIPDVLQLREGEIKCLLGYIQFEPAVDFDCAIVHPRLGLGNGHDAFRVRDFPSQAIYPQQGHLARRVREWSRRIQQVRDWLFAGVSMRQP
jgi:hypothetical protein